MMSFKIPSDIFNDIIYCQKSLRHYIKIHQMMAATLMLQNQQDDPRKDEIESEILDIGSDQRNTLNKLRLAMEIHFVSLENANVEVNRPEVNAQIAHELSANNVLFSNSAQPIHVKRRLAEAELILKYGLNDPIQITLPDPQSKSAIDTGTPLEAVAEKLEVLLNPKDIALNHHHNMQNQQQQIKQQVSLLKPKSERVNASLQTRNITTKTIVPPINSNQTVNRPFAVKMTPTPAMNNGRMNLLQALNKAKIESLNPSPTKKARPQTSPKQTSPRSLRAIPALSTVKCTLKLERKPDIKAETKLSVTAARLAKRLNSLSPVELSSSDNTSSPPGIAAATRQADNVRKRREDRSNALKRRRRSKSPSPSSQSSGGSLDGPDLPDEDDEPSILGKEAFLRVVGLCTHTYHAYLIARRSERKRRNVTSTEKGDFHYGRIETMFETSTLQTRSTKRMLLNSPQIAKSTKTRKPKLEKPFKKQKSDEIPPSSIGVEETKMCIACTKCDREKMSECEACNGYFHLACHNNVNGNGSSSSQASLKNRDKFCPDCLRRQLRSKDILSAQQRAK